MTGPMERIGRRFVDAFNRRDVDELVALADPDIEFHPTSIVGARRVYRGHDGLRRWATELGIAEIGHEVRVREVRQLDESRFLLLCEVLVDGELVTPSAMLARLTEAGRIVEAHAYLTDEETLTQVGIVPKQHEVERGAPFSAP
jgi:hypothetical protein